MPNRDELLADLRWKKFPVLDDGFVCLVDVMGDDSAVVQAARVSYGEGTKRVSDDRTLIRYLMRHRHSTPFEMAEIKFLVRVPMDAWRQWIRHRTACLAGPTRLSFDLPGARARGRRQHHSVPIETLYRWWTEGTISQFSGKRKPTFAERLAPDARYTVPELSRIVRRREETIRNMVRGGELVGERREGHILVSGRAWHDWAARQTTLRVPMRDRIARMRLRMCDEATGDIGYTSITDIWQSGVKPLFRVTLENGYRIEMTADHRCLTDRGWLTLREATGLRVGPGGSCTWDADAAAFAVNGIPAYQDRAWLAERRRSGHSVRQIAEAAGASYHTIRKYLRLFDMQYSAAEKGRLSGEGQRGRRRSVRKRGPLTGEALRRVRAARSGPAGNFWKGGVTDDRDNIGRWTTENAARVHDRCGYRCVICGSRKDLEAHHVDPVWNNPARARDLTNLISLCSRCHSTLHAANLEFAFLEESSRGEEITSFWERHSQPRRRPDRKRNPPVRRLRRSWSRVAAIESVGEAMTYDVSVDGPWHNFVANGFVVHNSVNEYSTRYSIAIDAAQATPPDEWRAQAASNRQGSEGMLSAEVGGNLSAAEAQLLAESRRVYEERLAAGVAREQARKDLPLSTYTEAYWKIDLHNLLHFLALRMDPHAQKEIRDYATAIGEQVVRPLFPIVWEAFEDYRLAAMHLTRLDIGVVGRLAASGSAAPYSEEAFLAAQDESWRELTRSRERDECRGKLVRLGLMRE